MEEKEEEVEEEKEEEEGEKEEEVEANAFPVTIATMFVGRACFQSLSFTLLSMHKYSVLQQSCHQFC